VYRRGEPNRSDRQDGADQYAHREAPSGPANRAELDNTPWLYRSARLRLSRLAHSEAALSNVVKEIDDNILRNLPMRI